MIKKSNPKIDQFKQETNIDIKISLLSLKSNFRVYIPFLCICVILFCVRQIIFYFIYITFIRINPSLISMLLSENLEDWVDLIIFSLVLCIGYGLAHDIMSSGDGFTFIKNVLFYPLKHYPKFFLLMVIIYLPFSSIEAIIIYSLFFTPNPWHILFLPIIFMVFSLFWFTIFIEAGPIMLQKENFFKSIKRSYHIFIKNKARIFRTWFVFWCVFYIPELILILIPYSIIFGIFTIDQYLSIIQVGSFLIPLQKLFQITFGYPFMALLSTRIYISLKTEKMIG